jgi:hypothetical protein
MRWAGEQGLNLLTGNIVTGETSDEFTAAQLALIKEYRSVIGAERPARVALGRVIVPFDSATAVTRARYRDYAASRHERTLRPQGPRRMLFASDLGQDRVGELRLELPYEFDRADYEQILHDARYLIAPELGWQPAPDAPLAAANSGSAARLPVSAGASRTSTSRPAWKSGPITPSRT